MIGRAARLASAAGAVLVLAACAGSQKPVVTMPKDGYLSAGVLDDMAAASPPTSWITVRGSPPPTAARRTTSGRARASSAAATISVAT